MRARCSLAGLGCGNLFSGGPELTRSEQKLREAVLVPDDSNHRSGLWNARSAERDGLPERDEFSVTAIDGSTGTDGSTGSAAGVSSPSTGAEKGSARRGLVDDVRLDEKLENDGDAPRPQGDAVVPHRVNESLARLEMNSLEVKLYLDSIDQRISRMEPRLEGMRGAEQEASRSSAGAVEGVEGNPVAESQQTFEERTGTETVPDSEAAFAAPAEEPQISPTTERRRRAQGVPVERRRAPHALPGEIGEGEPWAWRTSVEEWKTWSLAHRSWAPAVLLGLVTLAGLVYWSAGRQPGSHGQGPIADAGAVLSRAEPLREGKSSAEIPWGSAQGRDGRAGSSPSHVAEQRPGKTVVEQGVAVPLPRGAAIAGPGRTVPGPAATTTNSGSATNPGSAAVALTDPSNGANAAGGSAGGSVNSVRSTVNADDSDASVDPGSRSAPYGRIIPPSGNRVHVSSGVMAGSLIYSRPPTYPHGFARLFHTEGRVVMQAIISKSGRVENLRVISGHYMLRGAAKEAVRTWRYKPYHVNGSPVEVATIVSVDFQR